MLDLARRIFRLPQRPFTVFHDGTTEAHWHINNHAVYLIESKQTFYGPIYSLGPVELETLKTYIKTWPMDLSGLPSQQPELQSLKVHA